MEAPAILVTGERSGSTEIDRNVEKGSPEFEKGRKDKCEKGQTGSNSSTAGEGWDVRKREGRRKSEILQFPSSVNDEEQDKAKEDRGGQSRKREEKTRSGGKREDDRWQIQDEDAEGRSRKRGSSPQPQKSPQRSPQHQKSPLKSPHHLTSPSSFLLGADLGGGALRGRHGRRKSEVSDIAFNKVECFFQQVPLYSCPPTPPQPERRRSDAPPLLQVTTLFIF